MNTPILLVGLLTGSFLLIAGAYCWNRHLVRKHMAARASLTSCEFGLRYYPDNSELAATVRDILQKFIGADLSRLEPSDRPVQDLYLDAFDGNSPNDLIEALEDRFCIRIQDSTAAAMRTVDDVIKQVIAKVQEKVSAG